jgi:hypothetical protein
MSAQLPGAIHTTEIRDGVLLAGSDPHWCEAQPTSTATRALVQLARQFKAEGTLRAIALVGDLPDFEAISHFDPLDWRKPGSIARELQIVNARLDELHKAAGSGVELWRLKGNHCARWDKRLAKVAPEFVGCRGFSLDDQLDPAWRPAEVLDVNPGAGGLLLKHRHRGGANAARGNALAAGKSIATGHVHQPNATRLSNATSPGFWGIDLGTMADPRSPAFGYTEGAAAIGMLGWSSTFWVFTFADGRLLWPEPVHVVDEDAGLFTFRGRIHQVKQAQPRRQAA